MASKMAAEELAAKLEAGDAVQLEPEDPANPETPPAKEQEAQIENKPDASPEEKASLKAKPWKEYAQERRQWRDEKESILSELKDLKSRFEKQDGKEFEQELQTKIDELAAQEKASPAVIKGILDLAKSTQPSVDPSLSKELSEYREQVAFQKEWDGVLPELAELYPNASYLQLRKAERLMDEFSHSEDYSLEGAGKNIGLLDILEAEEPQFNAILASAKNSKGFETRERGGTAAEPAERKKPDFENMSFDQIREWESKRDDEDNRLEREMREKEGVKRF